MIVQCTKCNTDIQIRPSHFAKGAGRFCSMACRFDGRRLVPCAVCAKEFSVTAAGSEKRKTCSRRCAGVLRSKRTSFPCEHCGQITTLRPCYARRGKGRRFCSPRCAGLAKTTNWMKACAVCQKPFLVRQSDGERRVCCSRACASTHSKETGKVSGAANPAYGKVYRGEPAKIVPCTHCGTPVKRASHRLRKHPRPCCSRACLAQVVGRYSKDGPLNPNWRGGAAKRAAAVERDNRLRRTKEYREWRAAVLQRDGHRCVLCGSDDQLHADHIIPFALRPDAGMDLTNGRTLCATCHRATPTYGFRTQRPRQREVA